jgi:hypothetical protein
MAAFNLGPERERAEFREMIRREIEGGEDATGE